MKQCIFLIVLSIMLGLLISGCGKAVNPVDDIHKYNPENPQMAKRPAAEPALLPEFEGDKFVKKDVIKRNQLAGGATVVVDDDGGEDFTTIQDAVDSGAEKIIIRAGTYAENVTIPGGSDVTLEGSGVGATNVTGVAGTNGPIIDVLPGSKVVIKELTVDGGSAMSGGTDYGIRYEESDGRIKNVEVKNIRNASGSAQGIGIRVSSSGAKAKVRVEKTIVSNYTRVGIYGNGVGVKLTVKKCDIDGPVLPRVWAPNGIQISRGAEAKVRGNEVNNNPSPNPPGGAGSGILLFCAGPTNVKNNTVRAADLGIAVADNDGAKILNNDIYDSVFDGISLQFIGLFWGDIGCGVTPPENNLIKNNDIKDSGDTGVSLVNFDPTTISTTPNNNLIIINDIQGSAVEGIHIWDGADNRIFNNDISGSGSTDSVDDTSGAGTAGTANTWKNNSCSSSTPAGLCK